MLRVILLSASAFALSGCTDACSNKEIDRVTSQDGRQIAVMFQRDCGATTGFSTQVSLVDRAGAPAGGGNIFRADDDHGAAPAGEWGGPWAEMDWLAPDHLQISYAAKSRIFLQEQEVSGVRISYQQVNR